VPVAFGNSGGGLDTLLAVVGVLLVVVAAVVGRLWFLDAAGKARRRREEESRRREAAEQTQRQWWKAEGEARAYQAIAAARQPPQRPAATARASGPKGGRRAGVGSPASSSSPKPTKLQKPQTAFPQGAKPSKSLNGKLAQLLLVNGYSGNVLTVKSFATPSGVVGFQWEVSREAVAGAEPPRVCGRRGGEVMFVEYAWQGQKADVVKAGSRQYYSFTVTSPQQDEYADPDLEKDLGFEVVIPVEAERAKLDEVPGLNEVVGAFIRSYDEELGSDGGLPAGERNRLVETLRAKIGHGGGRE
jgi:hypothetical protein